MEAKEQSFSEIMERADEFKVPFFQRAYVWEKEKHWEKFFDDLYKSFQNKNGHFLGSVILKISQGIDDFALIIDGQQRLTTFSILFKALYDNLEKRKQEGFKTRLFRRHSSGELPKILHSEIDREYYNKVFQLSNQEITALNKENKIVDCYQFFIESIKDKEMDTDNIFNFMRFLEKTKIFVSVCIGENEDEQKIFDSINSTGEPLNSTDIIKNALFDKIIKESNEQEAIKLYEGYWKCIFEKDENERGFWDAKIGSPERYRSEIFLHAFAVIEGFFDYSKKHNISHIAHLYKEYIKSFDMDKFKKFLREIKEFAQIYRDFPQATNTEPFNFDDWKLRLFHIIDQYGITTTLPLLLKLEYQIKDNNGDLEQCLKLLEILLLCNTQNKAYNTFFAKLTQDLPENNDEICEYIKKEIMKSYGDDLKKEKVILWLNNISNKDAKIILFWIELCREFQEKDYKDKANGLCYVYELEHLMPIKWNKYWSEVANTDEEANKLIYQIGNMTLLKGKLNNEIKNREWNIKLNGNKKARNFIRKNADLCINKELLDIKVWDKNEIEKRTQEFIEDFFKIWDVEVFAK